MDRLRIVLAGLLVAPIAAGCGDDTMTMSPDGGGDGGMMTDAMTGEDGGGADAAPDASPDAGVEAPAAVYTLSNEADDNAVVAYSRADDGSLTELDSFSTGGKGSGEGLGSQGALVFDRSQGRFFAVNAGDDSISMLALEEDGTLTLESNVASGGIAPVSITAHDNVVYVVNAGDDSNPGNISGFRISGGELAPIDGSTLPLSADNPGPGQIQLDDDGSVLVVTEKGTSKILTYTMDAGVAHGPIVHPSSGMTPFGFAQSEAGQLIVSEAFGGMDGMGASSSYELGATDSGLSGISASVGSSQTAPCWVVMAGNHAYVTNTRSDTVTGYDVADDGTLTLKWSAPSGTKPIDAVVTDDDHLYVLNAGDDSFSIYGVDEGSGAISEQDPFTGLPASAVGLAAGPAAIYTMSNAAGGNEVMAYTRAADGSLSALDAYGTGDNGSGEGLGSQNGIVLDPSQDRLFAVNPGSDSISMFTVESGGALTLESTVDSGGVAPVSLTVHDDLVYVVNAGDDSTAANIAGFEISGGELMALADSSRPLSAANPGPGQIQFNADGDLLIVTEKGTSRIDTYTVDDSGLTYGPNAHPSLGMTPFGFALTDGGYLVVSEAFGAMDGMGASSSYSFGPEGSLSIVSGTVESGQTAPCWVAVAGDYAYITNTKTNNVSGYSVDADGSLMHQWDAATGMRPIDAAVSNDEGFLYVLNAGDHSFSIYAIDSATGLLTEKSALTDLPETAAGVVAR